MTLFIRMGLYFIFGNLAALGYLDFDQITGTVTIEVNNLAPTLIGVAGYAATFVWSRIAKKRGGAT